MAQSNPSNDDYNVVIKELNEFNKLVKGHEKLLNAIGNL